MNLTIILYRKWSAHRTGRIPTIDMANQQTSTWMWTWTWTWTTPVTAIQIQTLTRVPMKGLSSALATVVVLSTTSHSLPPLSTSVQLHRCLPQPSSLPPMMNSPWNSKNCSCVAMLTPNTQFLTIHVQTEDMITITTTTPSTQTSLILQFTAYQLLHHQRFRLQYLAPPRNKRNCLTSLKAARSTPTLKT